MSICPAHAHAIDSDGTPAGYLLLDAAKLHAGVYAAHNTSIVHDDARAISGIHAAHNINCMIKIDNLTRHGAVLCWC